MKKQLVWLLTGLVVVGLLAGCTPGASTSTNTPPAQTTSGMPPVVVVSGSNYEMGYQYGEQAADLIYHNLVILKSKVMQAYGEEAATKDMEVWSYYADEYDPGFRDWLEGMQAGCASRGYDVSYLDLILVTVYPAEMWCRPDAPYPEETGVEPIAQLPAGVGGEGEYHSCTTFAATGSATRDGKPVVGITKMVPPEMVNTLILIAFPDEGPSFIMNPHAGGLVQNSGMNSSGFAWVLTAIFGPPIWGVVTEVYFHYLAQYCESPAEAQEYIENSPRAGVTGTFPMSDAAGNISVIECNSQAFLVREPGDLGEPGPFMVSTNHLMDPSLQVYNMPDLETSNTWYRYVTCFEYIKEAAAKGEVDFEWAKAMYSSDDWYDDATGTWHYNEPGSNVNNAGVSQSIFFPADLIAYFHVGIPSGIGFPGGSTGEYVKLQLADNPAAVTSGAGWEAYGLCNAAMNFLAKELNRNAPYLTYSVTQSLEEMLDEAMLEWERGMDREAFANMAEVEGADINEQVALWSEALTHYAKSQLYAQMVITRLGDLAAAP